MDPLIFLDALMEALTSRNRAYSMAAIQVLETLIGDIFSLRSDTGVSSELPIFTELVSRMCHVCYKVSPIFDFLLSFQNLTIAARPNGSIRVVDVRE